MANRRRHHQRLLPGAGVLPDEMLEEILIKVPAGYVWEVRRVCKSWNALITHPQFASKHFQRNKNDPEHSSLLLIAFCQQLTRKSLSLFRLNQPHPPRTLVEIDSVTPREADFYTNFNFPDCFKEFVVVGSYNGILCISSFYKSFRRRFLGLWNPAINRWKPLPLPPRGTFDHMYWSVGLAFDSITNDYRIIRLVPVINEDIVPSSRIEMYSSNQNSWLDDSSAVPYFTTQPNCSVIIKGVPYWSRNYKPNDPIWNRYQSNVIATVDPHTGLYRGIEYPQIVTDEDTTVHPFNFMDSLAVLIYSPGENSNPKMFHVYTLDEKSPSACWIHLYTFTPTILQNTNMCILHCFRDADKIIVAGWNHEQGCSFLYDLQADCLCNSIGMDAIRPRWDETYHHVESLISLDGMEPILKVDGDISGGISDYLGSKYLGRDLQQLL